MANTYSKLYVQFVFAVNGRQNLIKSDFREELEMVISGIVAKNHCKLYAIYCNPDHTHLFASMNPSISPAKLMEQVKSGSTNWLNEKKYLKTRFSWQDGYGAFTYASSQIDRVVKYILNQPLHHKKQSFRDEYRTMLEKFDIDYNPRFLFEYYD